jgi:hypothetical protein
MLTHRRTDRQMDTTSPSHVHLMLFVQITHEKRIEHQSLNLVHIVLEVIADLTKLPKNGLSHCCFRKAWTVFPRSAYCVARYNGRRKCVIYTMCCGQEKWRWCRQWWCDFDTRGNFIRCASGRLEDCNFCNCTKLVIWQSNRDRSLCFCYMLNAILFNFSILWLREIECGPLCLKPYQEKTLFLGACICGNGMGVVERSDEEFRRQTALSRSSGPSSRLSW